MSDIMVGSEWIAESESKSSEVYTVKNVALNPDDGMIYVRLDKIFEGWDLFSKSDFLRKFKPKPDMVNHPPHYKDASGVECCQVTDLMMFNAASCFKYLYRCGNKWDDIEDLKKAVWYAKRSYLTGDNEQPNSLEWDNNVKAIASYREGGIYKAMTAIRSYSWVAVAAFIENEIARLESEAADD